MILNRNALIILLVISIHLMIFLAGILSQPDASKDLSREITTVNLLVDSMDWHIPSAPQHSVGINSGAQASKAPVSIISTASSSEPKTLASSSSGQGIQARDQFMNPKPPYPLVSRRMGEQGEVDLQLCIAYQGHVESVVVINSSGYERLDRSALETIKTWKFSALEMAEVPRSECYRLPINFTLKA